MQTGFLFLIICWANFPAAGQQAINPGTDSNTVIIHSDPRIATVIKRQIYLNTLFKTYQKGYRIQVVSTVNRQKANFLKQQLLEKFPQYRTTLSYQSPYFIVRMGDFKSRSDATGLEDEVRETVNGAIFIVPDIIQVNPDRDAGNDP
ncbi:MAG: SPOR domain-containing protein [Chitinophagaceae bacterium]